MKVDLYLPGYTVSRELIYVICLALFIHVIVVVTELLFPLTVSRSSSTPAFSNYSTPPRGSPVTMSVSADSTPSPRIMKPSSTRQPRESIGSSPVTPGN